MLTRSLCIFLFHISTSSYRLVRDMFRIECFDSHYEVSPWKKKTNKQTEKAHIKLPSSKNSHFPNKAKCKTFLVKMSFICMRVKTHFHINGFALSLALKLRLGAKSGKYDKISCIWSTFTTTSAFNPGDQCQFSCALSYRIVQIFPSDCSPRSNYGTNCFSSTEHLWISDRWKQS